MPCCELKTNGIPVKLWVPNLGDVESVALDQLRNIARLPWAVHHVAVMPDVHFGKGATVGSVVAMRGAVSPAAVGVDIGCGMGAVKTNLNARDLPMSLREIRLAIEADIPVGMTANERPIFSEGSAETRKQSLLLLDRFGDLDPRHGAKRDRVACQLGTLGGGNHFIELCLDTDENVWLMLHSGSRNIGKVLAEIHITTAKTLAHNEHLPDPDLAVFLSGTPEMAAYRHDLFWAQTYAMLNRTVMLERYQNIMRRFFPHVQFEMAVLCHHNYVSEEMHFGEELVVTRKGAIRAGLGELGIIPSSMGTKSYIVRGLGNPESYCSASHGAGRRLSRGAAKRQFTLQDLVRQTEGVECRKDVSVIDEIPGAYKKIDEVMANQADLVEIVAELKQVLCVKG
ncbi:MAG: RtcB family protein [Candidatus Uhrbacteria bacterium]|nr:RtcB family protein [Candidatus Uhrbacteria bacterium]